MDRVGPAAAALSRVGRDGALALRVERRGARSVLAAARCTLPLQVLAPVALDDPATVVSMLNPTGGLAGGDRLRVEAGVGPGAHACLTTTSATKVYRTEGPAAEHDVRLTVEAGGALEWVPDHTIPFAGSDFRQRIAVDLADGARLIVLDAFAAGRVARGEAWTFARYDSALTVRDPRGWLFHDRIVLPCQVPIAGPGLADGHRYFGTVLVAGPGADAGTFARLVPRVVAPDPGVQVGLGVLARGALVARVLAGTAPGLLQATQALWTLARSMLLDAPPLALRKG